MALDPDTCNWGCPMNRFSTLDRLREAKELWVAAMPKECPPPGDFEFLLWLDVFPTELIEFAIMRTSKKMRMNLREGIRLIPQAAQRYCTSVLTNRMKQRDDRADDRADVGVKSATRGSSES